MDIGLTGVDKGKGGKLLLLPPDYTGSVPEGYLAGKSSTYCVNLGVRGFQVDGKPDKAVALMKTTRIYPLTKAANPPAMTFVNGSHQEIDTIFSDNGQFFDDLAWMIEHEPHDVIPSHERFQLAAIGIEKGKPFKPSAQRRKLLDEAAQFASAIARNNSFASDDAARLVYPDRVWEWAFIGGSATWDSQGYVNTDRRASFRLHRDRHVARDGGETHRRRIAVSLDAARRKRRVPRRRQELSPADSAEHPGQELLVGGGLRRRQPFDSAQ